MSTVFNYGTYFYLKLKPTQNDTDFCYSRHRIPDYLCLLLRIPKILIRVRSLFKIRNFWRDSIYLSEHCIISIRVKTRFFFCVTVYQNALYFLIIFSEPNEQVKQFVTFYSSHFILLELGHYSSEYSIKISIFEGG